MAITRWGPDAPAPIVLLHGWMDCGAAWQLLVDCLPDDWPLLAVDWPGYGRSARRADHYWFPEHFAELDWLLDEISPHAPARLIGHSMGGTVASMYAGIRPARVAWLVNMEGFGMPALPQAQLPGLVAGWLDSLRALPAAAALRQSRRPGGRAAARQSAPAAGECALPRARLDAPGGRRLRDTRPIRASSCARRSAMRAPTSRAAGRTRPRRSCCCTARSPRMRDNVLGNDGLARMRQLIPALTVESIAEAGHMLLHEQPQQVAAAITRFAAAQA